MASSNDVEDTTPHTNLLPPPVAGNTRSLPREMSYKFNYFLAVINFLVVVLAVGSAGLSASTLDWVTSTRSSDVYQLNPNIISGPDAPDSVAISELPVGVQTIGCRLTVAIGIISALSGALAIFFIVKQSLRSVKPYDTTPKDSTGRLLATAGLLATSAVITVSVLIYTWNQNYQMPDLVISYLTMLGGVYQRTWYTPEAWAQRLSPIIRDQDDASTIHARYIIASTGRILLAPMAALQILSLVGLFAVRDRTTPAPAPGAAVHNRDVELQDADIPSKTPRVAESSDPSHPHTPSLANGSGTKSTATGWRLAAQDN